MSEVAPLSQDVVQTDDSARHVQRVAQEKQLASALEPAQIVTLQNQARAAVYEAHRASGKSGLPDDATLQNAGNKAVAEARQAKVAGNPVVVVRPSAPPAPVPYQEQQRPSAAQTIHGQRVHAPAVTAMVDLLTAHFRKFPAEWQDANRTRYETELRQIYEGTHPKMQPAPDVVAAARATVAAADVPAGFVAIAGADLSGYSIPPEVAAAGHKTMQTVAIDMLKTARRAGIPQEVVTRYFLAELKS